jgi:hypothetical protein
MIPLFGNELFKSIKDKDKSTGSSPIGNLVLEVKLTMMEIQENKVKDLLMGSNTKYKTIVKVRDHPKRGYYGKHIYYNLMFTAHVHILEFPVEGLRSVILTNADDLQQRLDEGIITRAINSTSLNLSSINSSSTVIVGLSLVQKYRNTKGDEVVMSSLIDFYDLPVR